MIAPPLIWRCEDSNVGPKSAICAGWRLLSAPTICIIDKADERRAPSKSLMIGLSSA